VDDPVAAHHWHQDGDRLARCFPDDYWACRCWGEDYPDARHWGESRWDEFHSGEDYSVVHRWDAPRFPDGSPADCSDWLPVVLQALQLGGLHPVQFAGLGAPSGDEYRIGWAGFQHGPH